MRTLPPVAVNVFDAPALPTIKAPTTCSEDPSIPTMLLEEETWLPTTSEPLEAVAPPESASPLDAPASPMVKPEATESIELVPDTKTRFPSAPSSEPTTSVSAAACAPLPISSPLFEPADPTIKAPSFCQVDPLP